MASLMGYFFNGYGTLVGRPKAKTNNSIFSEYAARINFCPEPYLYMLYGKPVSDHTIERLGGGFRDWFNTQNTKCLIQDTSSIKNGIDYGYSVYHFPREQAIITLTPFGGEKQFEYRAVLFHTNSLPAKQMINVLHGFYIPAQKKVENKISLIVQYGGDLRTEEYKIKIGDIDVPLYYGKDFVPVYNKVLAQLKQEESKGLVLFHGEPGAGKTSIIKYIAKQLNKEVIFVPPNMGDSLCSPSIVPFLLQHKNSILVIEDAERIISDRDNKMFSEGVSSILNITDGILGDCLNIQIICTFNTERDKIDKALLRKGRLIAEHKFAKLDVDESNDLLNHLGKGRTTNIPLSLAEIFNCEEMEFITGKKEPVGFKIAS